MENGLDDKLARFFSSYQNIVFKNREIILRGEDSPQGVYFIKTGYIRSFLLARDGSELTLNIFKPTSVFPLTWAMCNIPNSYFYETLTSAKVYRAPKTDVVNFIKEDKEILLELNKRILAGLNAILVRLQYLTLGDAYHKVANALLLLGRRFGVKTDNKLLINLPITHRDIACLAGVTRETVSIELQKLEKDRFIKRTKRFYVVNNLKKLQKESLISIGGKLLTYTF